MLNSVNDFQLKRIQAIVKPSKTVYVSLPSVTLLENDMLSFNLRNAKMQGSIEQVYGPRDDQHSTAYQIGSVALGGKTQAGMTEEEFLERYPSGVDGTGRTWAESYAFATSTGSDTRARGRASFAGGTGSEANYEDAVAFGYYTKVDATNCFGFGYNLSVTRNFSGPVYSHTAVGQWNLSNWNILFSVGNGTSESTRSNAIEVANSGRIYCYLTEDAKASKWQGDLLTRREVEEYLDTKLNKPDTASNAVITYDNSVGQGFLQYTNATPYAGRLCTAASSAAGNSVPSGDGYYVQYDPIRKYHVSTKRYTDHFLYRMFNQKKEDVFSYRIGIENGATSDVMQAIVAKSLDDYALIIVQCATVDGLLIQITLWPSPAIYMTGANLKRTSDGVTCEFLNTSTTSPSLKITNNSGATINRVDCYGYPKVQG